MIRINECLLIRSFLIMFPKQSFCEFSFWCWVFHHRLSFYLFWVKFSKKWKIILQKINTMKLSCYKFPWLIVIRINVCRWLEIFIEFSKVFFLNFSFCVQHAHFIIDSFFSNIIFEKCLIILQNNAHCAYCLHFITRFLFVVFNNQRGIIQIFFGFGSNKWFFVVFQVILCADCFVDYEIS